MAEVFRWSRRDVQALLAYAHAVGKLPEKEYRRRLRRLSDAHSPHDFKRHADGLLHPGFPYAQADTPLLPADRLYVSTLVGADGRGGREGGWWLGKVISNARTAGELQAVIAGFVHGDFPDANTYPELTAALLRRSLWQEAWLARSVNQLSKMEFQVVCERIESAADVTALQALKDRPAMVSPGDNRERVGRTGRTAGRSPGRPTGEGARGTSAPPGQPADMGRSPKPRGACVRVGFDDADGPAPAAGVPAQSPTVPAASPAPRESVAQAPPNELRLRISDMDRQRADEALAAALADGRLSPDEYGNRLQAVPSAKTYGDLLPLVQHLDALASNAEREQVIRAIEAAGQAGSLDPAEKLDLLQAAWAAATDAELSRLSSVLESLLNGGDGARKQTRRRMARVADADRERVVLRLRLAVAEGRLTLDEYDDRVRRTYAARHFADFEPLLADLPEPDPVTLAAMAAQSHRNEEVKWEKV